MVQVRFNGKEETLSWEEWESRVRAGRISPEAEIRFEPATGEAWVPARDLEMFTSLSDEATRTWQARFKQSDPPWMTAVLVGIQIRLWWFAWWTPEVARFFTEHLTLDATRVYEDAEVWRIFSMGFIHLAFFHAMMNLVWLAYTGWNLERALGRLNLLLLYVTSVAAGSLLSIYGDPISPSLGASGGVYGLVGASVVFGLVRPNLLPEAGRRLFGWALVPYLVLMASSGMNSDDIDNWSHLGGLIAGSALVLFLDPPEIQRSLKWNARIRNGVTAALLLIPLTIGLFGPRMTPLWTEAEARAAIRPERVVMANTQVQYSVPAGWVPDATAAGIPGFRSHQRWRSWSVRHREHTQPTNPAALHETFLSRLQDNWASARWEPSDSDVLRGDDTLTMQAEIPNDDGVLRTVVWTGSVRGLFSIESVWEVRKEDERRLKTLQRRLQQELVWPESDPYRTARIDYEFDPSRKNHQVAWGLQLARHGQAEQAAPILRGLTETHPESESYWKAWLDLLQWYPEFGDPPAAYDAALRAHPTDSMVGEICQRLQDSDEPQLAAGLSDLAWLRLPGERSLKRHRRRLGLATSLVDGRPYDLTHDPVTGKPRSEPDIASRRDTPWTVANARQRADTLESERQQVIEALVQALRTGNAPEVTRLAVVLHTGAVGEDPTKTLEDLKWGSDATNPPPRWIPSAVIEATRTSPMYTTGP